MLVRFVFGAALLAALSGCAASSPTAPSPTAPTASAPTASSGETPSELEALYWQRQADARADYTDADVDFMAGMIGHHAQALVMSRMAPTHGASPAVQRLAARIINAQNDEIESMQRWLRLRGEAVPVPQIDGLMLTVSMEEPAASDPVADGMDHGAMDHGGADGMDHSAMDHAGMGHGGMSHGMMDHSGMPGMLSQAQLEELDAARGRDFDRLFLRYMIQHHGGALTMADALFADGGAQDEEAFKLASDINVDQETEIARMQLMLDEIGE